MSTKRGLELAAVALLSGAFAACGSSKCPELPAAAAVSNQPYGGACVADADCETGLVCLGPMVPNSGWKMCSRPCDPCPAGTAACLTFDTATGAKMCIPSCASDADCVRGDHVMRCAKSAGEDTGQCLFIQCQSSQDVCPGGSHCVGEVCQDLNPGYALQSGYCQKDR